jgi:hypothetical protein
LDFSFEPYGIWNRAKNLQKAKDKLKHIANRYPMLSITEWLPLPLGMLQKISCRVYDGSKLRTLGAGPPHSNSPVIIDLPKEVLAKFIKSFYPTIQPEIFHIYGTPLSLSLNIPTMNFARLFQDNLNQVKSNLCQRCHTLLFFSPNWPELCKPVALVETPKPFSTLVSTETQTDETCFPLSCDPYSNMIPQTAEEQWAQWRYMNPGLAAQY